MNKANKKSSGLLAKFFSWIFHPMPDPFIHYREPGLSIHFSSNGKVMPGVSLNTVFTTDKMGFRTRSLIDYSRKGENTKRIFFLGGSTSDLAYIDDKEIFTYLLEEELELAYKGKILFEVINAARSGLSSVNNYDQAKDLLRFKPDYFVFLLGANDILENLRNLLECKNTPEAYLTVGKNKKNLRYFLTRLPPVRSAYRIRKITKAISQGKRSDVGGKRYKRLREQRQKARLVEFTPEINKVPEFYKINVRAIGELVRKNKIHTLFLTQPVMYFDNITDNLDKLLWMTPGYCDSKLSVKDLSMLLGKFNDVLREESTQNEYIDLIDLAKLLSGNAEFFYDDYHFNVAGSKKMSEIVFEYFVNKFSI